MNRIIAEVKKGKYKGQQIELDIGSAYHNSEVRMNGEPIKNVQAVHLHMKVGQPHKLVIEKVEV